MPVQVNKNTRTRYGSFNKHKLMQTWGLTYWLRNLLHSSSRLVSPFSTSSSTSRFRFNWVMSLRSGITPFCSPSRPCNKNFSFKRHSNPNNSNLPHLGWSSWVVEAWSPPRCHAPGSARLQHHHHHPFHCSPSPLPSPLPGCAQS